MMCSDTTWAEARKKVEIQTRSQRKNCRYLQHTQFCKQTIPEVAVQSG